MASEPRNPDLPGILRLSPAIRQRIYLQVGLGRWRKYGRTVHRVYNLGEQYEFQSPITNFYERPQRGFHGLLVSCRTIYTEASALLYSSHWFLFRYQPAKSLAPLRSLSPVSIASLTNLRVILIERSCHAIENGTEGNGGCCESERLRWYCENVHQHEKKLHNAPLRMSDPSAKVMLTEWQATAAHLAAHVGLGQLDLSLVCDVDEAEIELANQVVDALQPFSQLRDCHIRLSRTPNLRLRELAQDAVSKARGIRLSEQPSDSTASPKQFPLLNLPVELRLSILKYTDIITPLKEVMWSRCHGKYLATRPFCPSWDGRGDHDWAPKIHHGCQFDSCSLRPYPQWSIGCFCRRDHAAFSSTCRCWAPPTPLFLVCRLLRDDANLAFFSGNRFVVIDGPTMCLFGPPYPGVYKSNRLAASQFLKDVVPAGCHRHLRFLELVFPPWAPGSWPQDENHPTLQDWSDTVDWVKNRINGPALTMRMTAKFHSDEGYTGDPSELTEAEAEETMEVYFRIMRPLARLGGIDGLAGFSADLTWPWRRLSSALHVDYERLMRTDKLTRSKERSLNKQAERLVLGDKYDCLCSTGTEITLPKRGSWESVYIRDY